MMKEEYYQMRRKIESLMQENIQLRKALQACMQKNNDYEIRLIEFAKSLK